jgi:HD-GYP domain-containing protein (c-di-GMP phosphodiesterase class II)
MTADAHGRSYIAIPRDLVAADTATGVDLHVRVGAHFLLYRSGREPVDVRSLAKLRRRAVETLYIEAEARPALDAYLARMLDRRLDEAPSIEAVGAILRDSVTTSLRGAFQQLDDSNAIQRVRDASDAAVRRIAGDNQVVPHLVRFALGDERLYVHSMNTAAYAIALASRRDELDLDTLRSIGIGALAHDVGLASTDPTLLGRDESALTEGERAYLAKHPQRGHGMLVEADIEDPIVLDIAHDHHTLGAGLPLHVQIVQLADTFDALTNRPGRTDSGAYRALYTLRESMRGRYRPDLLRDFVLMLGSLELDDESAITPLHPPPEAAKPAFRSPNVA